MARVLILRPRIEADATAAGLLQRGHEPLVLPLHEIVPLDAPAPGPTDAFGGFIVTSSHAVLALSQAFPRDARPVLAVGERTADALLAAGFADVRAGSGGAEVLADAAAALAARSGWPLLYAAGRVRTRALEERLSAAGVGVSVWEVYDTRPIEPDLAEIEALIGARPPDVVLLLSVGQADAYRRLAERLSGRLVPGPRLLCLSHRIAAALPVELRDSAEISGSMSISALFDLIR